MNSMPFLALAVLVALLQPGQSGPEDVEGLRRQTQATANKYRQEAIRINDMAGSIQTEADAHRLVDAVSDMFDELLRWLPRGVRHRVAQAEYKAATGPAHLLTEERIAGVWNEYVREIGADEEANVTANELHTLRELLYVSGKIMWSEGQNQTIWTAPNVYAVAPDGKLADGCRALEALRLFYELDSHLGNAQIAKRLVREGINATDLMRQAEERRRRGQVRYEVRAVAAPESPVGGAERRYVAERGVGAMRKLVLRLFDELLRESAG